ncbi:MAG: DUF937 domain-containing protein, partial [Hyphomicrobiaceae bacterium]
MSNSLLDALSGMMSPELVRTAAKATGETPDGISAVLGAAIPAILGQMAQGSGNSTMMDQIIGMARSPAVDDFIDPGRMLSQIGGVLGGSSAGGAASGLGETLLNALFGKNVGAIIAAIAGMAGLRNSSTVGALLKFAGPMVLAAIAKRLGGSMSGKALGALLGQERDGIMAALPGPLVGAMGLMGGGGSATAGASAAAATAATSAAAVAAGSKAVNTAAGVVGAAA